MKKAVVFLFTLSLCVLSGCNLSASLSPGGVDMSPRLISVADDLNTSEIVEAVKGAVVGISTALSSGYSVGSGVAIANGGYIITNHHVIDGANSIKVYFANNTEANAELIWSDSALDIALIKSNKNLPYLDTADSSTLKVGEDVIAIGTPLALQFRHTVTKGIVSALNRTLEIGNYGGTTTLMQNLIQHDASINPGNSGGPLINSSGRVVGINTLKASDAEGIAFAIPIEVANSITSRFVSNANYKVPYLGMYGYDSSIAKFNNLSNEEKGVYIEDLKRDSCLACVGVQKGDVILEINGESVNNMLQLRQILYRHDDGQEVIIKFVRDGQYIEKTIKLCTKQD